MCFLLINPLNTMMKAPVQFMKNMKIHNVFQSDIPTWNNPAYLHNQFLIAPQICSVRRATRSCNFCSKRLLALWKLKENPRVSANSWMKVRMSGQKKTPKKSPESWDSNGFFSMGKMTCKWSIFWACNPLILTSWGTFRAPERWKITPVTHEGKASYTTLRRGPPCTIIFGVATIPFQFFFMDLFNEVKLHEKE